MAKLIEELETEHKIIVDALHKAKDLLITTEEGQETLRSAKIKFLEHLKKEDEELYPILRKAAESDSELREFLNNHEAEMEVVSKQALDFFDKYSDGGNDEKFAADFARLYIKVSRRIKNEEKIIYKKYEELTE